MYCGYIVKIDKLRKHTNADRLQIATVFGNDVSVGLDVKLGDILIYFPTDGQLSTEYCEYNNLLRKRDANGDNIGGYLDPSKRNVKAIKLRGEKSDGLLMPLSSLDYFEHDELNVGDKITVLNGHEICTKYIPRTNSSGPRNLGNKTRKRKAPISPLFIEHADTEQLAYNLNVFKPGDEIEITLKMHGTSQRTGYLPVFKKFKRSLLDIILRRPGKPIYDWGYVTGTRRVVLDTYDGGYYGGNQFREQHAKFFEGKLLKGEEVFYEVVGYIDENNPIMGKGNNKKINDKDFLKKYGDTTVFSYGCNPGESKAYVYRMTMTNEDGDIVEYTPDFMRYRCEQMGANTVPMFTKFIIPDIDYQDATTGEQLCVGDYVKDIAEEYYDGTDPIGRTHIREGVVVRIVNRPKFCAYKHKNFFFKVLEGLIKEDATAPDVEEAQEVLDEN